MPKTGIVTARCDIRRLAEIAKYYHSIAVPISNKSNLLSMTIEDFANLLVQNEKTERILSTKKADAILVSMGVEVEKNRRVFTEQVNIETLQERAQIEGTTDDSLEQEIKKAMENFSKLENDDGP